jgi:phosphotransferase system enzyme I (PtsI)
LETIQSIGASHGFGFGNISIYTKEIDFNRTVVHTFSESREKLVKEFESKVELLKSEERNIESEVLGSYILLLTDPDINSTLDSSSTIEDVFRVFEENAKQMEMLEDEYFSQREEDIRSLCKDVIIMMQGSTSSFEIDKGTVLVAEDLTPTDTSNMELSNIEGLIIKNGGPTSHAVIVAKNLGIPCVIGLNENYTRLKEGQKVIVNGENGEVVINPSEEIINEIKNKVDEYRELIDTFTKEKLNSSDIDLRVNIGSFEEIESFNSEALESVGLFRSEFIFLDSKEPPSLDEQINVNNQLSIKFPGKVIYRLLDVGGDKQVEYLNTNKEENPFLGVRGIRLIDSNESVFRSQLESIFKSELYGKTKVMLPMVSTVEDLSLSRELIQTIAEKEGKEPLPMGIMIETPSAALIANKLAEKVDFFSIGTNDLIQYTLAADRGNVELRKYQDPLHPSVLRLVRDTISAGKDNNIEVSVCGEMASDPTSALILYSLGLRVFSISPASAPLIFHTLMESKFLKNKTPLKIEDFSTAEEIRQYVNGNN